MKKFFLIIAALLFANSAQAETITTTPVTLNNITGVLGVSKGGSCGNGTIRAATTDDTFVVGDCGNLVTIGSTAPVSETIPPDSSVSFPTLSQINIMTIGTSTSTIVAGSGVTLRFQGSAVSYVTFMYPYAIATLIKIGENEWKIAGEVE